MIINEVEALIIAVIVLEFVVPLLILTHFRSGRHNNKTPR